MLLSVESEKLRAMLPSEGQNNVQHQTNEDKEEQQSTNEDKEEQQSTNEDKEEQQSTNEQQNSAEDENGTEEENGTENGCGSEAHKVEVVKQMGKVQYFKVNSFTSIEYIRV